MFINGMFVYRCVRFSLNYVIEMFVKTLCNTSVILSRISTINETEDSTDCVLGSMDVESLYPSIDVDFAVEKCVELLQESDITFENVQADELGLYITLQTLEEERKKEGIADFCPTRIRRGKRPTITGCGSYTGEKLRWSFHQKAKVHTGPKHDKEIDLLCTRNRI